MYDETLCLDESINFVFKSIQDERKFKLLESELFDLLREELTGQYKISMNSQISSEKKLL